MLHLLLNTVLKQNKEQHQPSSWGGECYRKQTCSFSCLTNNSHLHYRGRSLENRPWLPPEMDCCWYTGHGLLIGCHLHPLFTLVAVRNDAKTNKETFSVTWKTTRILCMHVDALIYIILNCMCEVVLCETNIVSCWQPKLVTTENLYCYSAVFKLLQWLFLESLGLTSILKLSVTD